MRNVNLPVNQTLAEKFRTTPAVIGYVRTALLRQDQKYNLNSLVSHIHEQNNKRRDAIRNLRITATVNNVDKRQGHIAGLQKQIDFRQNVLSLLRSISDQDLMEILKPV